MNYTTNEQKLKLLALPYFQRWNEYRLYGYFEKLWHTFWTGTYAGSRSDKILDFGCGPCFASLVGDVLGFADITNVDIDTYEARSVFGQYAKVLGQVVDYWDGVVMPFEDDCFDAIVSRASFAKLTETSIFRQIKQLGRITKQKGVWYVAPREMYERIIDKIGNKGQVYFGDKVVDIVIWDYPLFPKEKR